jgi:hypothetical protein
VGRGRPFMLAAHAGHLPNAWHLSADLPCAAKPRSLRFGPGLAPRGPHASQRSLRG